MRLKDYAGFRKILSLNDLRYDIDVYSNKYIVTDRKGNELISLNAYDVRNNFDKVRDDLITAVAVNQLFSD